MNVNTVQLFANVNRSKINITDTHYEIKGIPITVDDAVMNDIHYESTHNAKGIPSIKGQPIALSHPVVDGVNVSGKEGRGLEDYYSGSTVNGSVYNTNGVWYVDASINKKKLLAQDDGERYANAFDNKQDIAVSTGLTFEYNEESGVNSKGEKYSKKAINQKYDHLAILLDEAPAGGEATVMRFNSKDKSHINVNELIEISANKTSKDNWINKLIKFAANKSGRSFNQTMGLLNDKISKKYESSGKYCWVVEVYDDYLIYEDDRDFYKVEYLIDMSDNVTLIGEPEKVVEVREYIKANNIEVDPMKQMLINALTEAGINTDGLDDAKLFETYNAMKEEEAKKKPGKTPEEIEKEKKEKDKANKSDIETLTKAVDALTETVSTIQQTMQTNSDSQLKPKREAVMNHFSMDESEVKALPETTLNKLFSQTKGFAPLQANNFTSNSGKSDLDDYLPE